MIAKIILLIFLAIFIVVIVRALISGRIEYGSGNDYVAGDRAGSPGTYWTILAFAVAMTLFFSWLLFT